MMPLVNRTSSSMSNSANLESSHGFSSHGSKGIQIQVIKASDSFAPTDEERSTKQNQYEETDTLLSKSSSQVGDMALSNGRSSSPLDILRMTTNEMIREIAMAFVVLIIGWYGPKKFFVPVMMGGIRQRPIPYQISNDGSVILDFDLLHPLVPKDQVIVPSNPLIFIGVWLPWIVMICVCYFIPINPSIKTTNDNENTMPSSSSSYRWSLATLATCLIFVSTGLSELTTQILKAYVGRLRPNFYAMCQFDTATHMCMASIHEQNESRQSFPSGHSSLSMQGMMSLSLFLIGQLWLMHRSSYFNNGNNNKTSGSTTIVKGKNRLLRPSMASMCLAAVVPIWISLFVGATRLADTWHHPSDVLAGWILGGWCAMVSYTFYFSSLSSLYDL